LSANDKRFSGRPRWCGPVGLPEALARSWLRSATALAEALGPGPRWLLVGVLLGVVPLGLDYLLGWSTNHLVTALLVTPVLVAAVVVRAPFRGLGVLVAVFVAHSALVILLAARDPAGLSLVLKDGDAYWQRSHTWITTGASREYDLGWWLPAHFQFLAAMVFFTCTSLGFVPLWQGLHEVDLMNFYVGRLLAHSHSPGLALAAGWHPWSVCRGIGYLVLTYELAGWSFARLTGAPWSPPRVRLVRWLVGLSFLALDGVIKFTCLESVRQVLAGNLR
jgi:hypothetical protein